MNVATEILKNVQVKSHVISKIIEYMPEGTIITDADLNIIMFNPAFKKLCGFQEKEIINQHIRIISSGWYDPIFYRNMWRDIKLNGYWQGEIRNKTKQGKAYLAWLQIVAITDDNNSITHYMAMLRDVTERKEEENRLFNLANFDPLTGLANRAFAELRFTESIEKALTRNISLTIYFIDLDRFKPINDSFGHKAGDILLTAVADRLRHTIRDCDLVARIGGDEFVILLENLTYDQSYRKASEMSKSISHPYMINDNEVYISSCIGISTFPNDGDDMETLISKADAAMYNVKKNGKDGFSFFSDEMQRNAAERYTMESELRHAIERNELQLHYQPQVDLLTAEIIGAEALLRWNSKKLGPVSPAKFIPLAEETGLIIDIGTWVFEQAAKQRKEWLNLVAPHFKLAVNLSVHQLYIENIAKQSLSIVRLEGLSANNLSIEITESILMADPEKASSVLTELKEMSFSVALDDFGTGYSSLAYLREFHIDKLKIDKSFVDSIPGDNDSETIIETIIAMSKKMGLTVIAEGAEELEQIQFLQHHQCHEIQGYYCYKPLPPDEFEQAYNEKKGYCPKILSSLQQ